MSTLEGYIHDCLYYFLRNESLKVVHSTQENRKFRRAPKLNWRQSVSDNDTVSYLEKQKELSDFYN